MQAKDDGFGLIVFGVSSGDVFAVAEEGVVACFSCCVFDAFAFLVDVDFVDCGGDVVVGEECLCVGGDLCGVFLELVVNDDGVEVVVFVFHGVCECE